MKTIKLWPFHRIQNIKVDEGIWRYKYSGWMYMELFMLEFYGFEDAEDYYSDG